MGRAMGPEALRSSFAWFPTCLRRAAESVATNACIIDDITVRVDPKTNATMARKFFKSRQRLLGDLRRRWLRAPSRRILTNNALS